MLAIETHYLGPTDTKGSRYVASIDQGKRVIIAQDGRISSNRNHTKAASTLRSKLDWAKNGPMISGHTKHGMAWVFTQHSQTI